MDIIIMIGRYVLLLHTHEYNNILRPKNVKTLNYNLKTFTTRYFSISFLYIIHRLNNKICKYDLKYALFYNT